MKKTIRMNERELHRMISESVKRVLNEDKKKKKKQDPMTQWFNDFNKASKYRETMDYVNKGGRNPLSKKKENNLDEVYDKEDSGQQDKGKPKRELENALRNVLGVLCNYLETDFGLSKKNIDDLYEICRDYINTISDTYDFGPYEDDPYYFGY